MSRCAAILLALLTLTWARSARASGYDVSLELSQGPHKQTAATQSAHHRGPLKTRPSLQGSAGKEVTVKWKLTRTAHEQANDVLVHFFVVKIDRAGASAPPLDQQHVELESALSMDFPQGESASASQPLVIDKPGVYLVRIEAGTSDDPGHDAASEMELVIGQTPEAP